MTTLTVFFDADITGLISSAATYDVTEPIDRVLLHKVCARRCLREFAKNRLVKIVSEIRESKPVRHGAGDAH